MQKTTALEHQGHEIIPHTRGARKEVFINQEEPLFCAAERWMWNEDALGRRVMTEGQRQIARPRA